MPLFYVKIRKNIDICNYLPIYYPAICRGWGTFSVPSLGEGWDGVSMLGWGLLLEAWGQLRVLPNIHCACEGDEINTKSRVVDGGFALAWTVAPTVGKRVFLRVVSTIPTIMHRMTPSAATVKKAAFGRSKSPAFAGTKKATRVFLIIMQGITPMG